VAAADAVFCSEFIEHVPNRDLPAVLDALEAVARRKLVITVPNRLSPHAHMDPTHVLRYRLGSLLRQLNRSRRFAYTLHPLGFADAYRRRPWCRPLDVVARRVALLSPTVLYVGRRREAEPTAAEGRGAPRRPAGGPPDRGRPGASPPGPGSGGGA
jgi:hypothetical protein